MQYNVARWGGATQLDKSTVYFEEISTTKFNSNIAELLGGAIHCVNNGDHYAKYDDYNALEKLYTTVFNNNLTQLIVMVELYH